MDKTFDRRHGDSRRRDLASATVIGQTPAGRGVLRHRLRGFADRHRRSGIAVIGWGFLMVAGVIQSVDAGDGVGEGDSAGDSVVHQKGPAGMDVMQRSAEVTITSECKVTFSQQIDVPSLQSGQVAAVLTRQNEAVRSGAVLVKLDDRSALIRRQPIVDRIEAARRKATDTIEVRYAEAALEETTAEYESFRNVQRDMSGAVAVNQLRRLALAVERAKLEVSRAEKARIDAETELRICQSDLSAVDHQLQQLSIVSPIDGMVLEVSRSPGEWVQAGQRVAQVARIDRLEVHALAAADQLRPGAESQAVVTVTWRDAFDQTERSLPGRLLSIDPLQLPGNRYRIHAEVDNALDATEGGDARWALHPGTPVTMTIRWDTGSTAAAAGRQAFVPSPSMTRSR